eukprot:CAMPEP_0116879426 /NCGR_PEP_ID=MMETSP0463-20121206/11240_1 /TAXON_ID=181622 /ORGANISM="Strombidinopsis sp, Strain SopsisLIS2011" /LENGTH=115 /DNA_ID=CAMNT_0004528763 /DNA_START=213 /DNA_END=560 /DNA_ORIENTATION=+
MSFADAEDYQHQAQYLNLYFKNQFRKLSHHDAIDMIAPLGQDGSANKVTGLDDKFWVWETIEEAIRGHVEELPADKAFDLYKGFAYNYKGSLNINAEFERRVLLESMTNEKLFKA